MVKRKRKTRREIAKIFDERDYIPENYEGKIIYRNEKKPRTDLTGKLGCRFGPRGGIYMMKNDKRVYLKDSQLSKMCRDRPPAFDAVGRVEKRHFKNLPPRKKCAIGPRGKLYYITKGGHKVYHKKFHNYDSGMFKHERIRRCNNLADYEGTLLWTGEQMGADGRMKQTYTDIPD